jgi:vacuolar-type H+-ATPase subunit E/Vma4
MAKAKSSAPLVEVRTAVRRLQSEGERLVARARRDAQALLTRGRGEIVRDVRQVRRDLQVRAERALRTLEKRIVKELHAATEERVATLEKRVGRLEAQLRETGGGR